MIKESCLLTLEHPIDLSGALDDGLYHLVYGGSSSYDAGCQDFYLGYNELPPASTNSSWGYARLLPRGTLNPPLWKVEKVSGSPNQFTLTLSDYPKSIEAIPVVTLPVANNTNTTNSTALPDVQLSYDITECTSMMVRIHPDKKSTWTYFNNTLVAAAKNCSNNGTDRIYFGLSDVIPLIYPPPGCTDRSMGMLPYGEYWRFEPYIPYPQGPVELYGYRNPAFDEIGKAVSLHEDLLVVGGRKQAFLFNRTSPGEWTRGRLHKPRKVSKSSLFGKSVAVDGSLVAVGAPGSGVNATAGAAVVFSTKSGSAKVLGVIYGNSTGATKRFGTKVAVSGRILAIADQEDAGAVYLYASKNLTAPLQILKSPDADNEKNFGRLLSFAGDKLVIAASSTNSTLSGKIHVFSKSAKGEFTLQTSLSCPGGNGTACTASTLSTFPNLNLYLWNDTLAAAHNGVVHVYDYGGGTNWNMTQRITGNGSKFGSSLSHYQGTLVAGEYYRGSDAKKSRVSVWSRTADFPGGVWEDRGEVKLKYPVQGDGFGTSAVAVYGDVVAIGAPGWKQVSGTVYAFRNPALFYTT